MSPSGPGPEPDTPSRSTARRRACDASAVGCGYVGILRFELHVPSSGSLKEKRRHVLHARSQLERRFGASVAEVGHQDLWQRAALTMVIVRSDHAAAVRCLADAERYLSAQEYELAGARRAVLSVQEDLEL